MAYTKVTFSKTGPFFTKDPEKTLQANARVMMEAMAAAGETEAKSLATPYRVTGDFIGGVVGRTHRLDGMPFKHPGLVVSQTFIYPWKSAGARQYRGGKLEAARHIFRVAYSRIRSVRKLNVAELLKGLN